MGTPHFYTGIEREDTWCLGSQLWATNYAQKGTAVYQYGIVLDMIGAPNASFPREMYSTKVRIDKVLTKDQRKEFQQASKRDKRHGKKH
jgi:hypothetical protein